MVGRLICIGGLPGVGKTRVAQYLAGVIIGSVMLDPDKIRLEILGREPESDTLVDADITEDTTAQVIELMYIQAQSLLEERKTVIIGSAFNLEFMRVQYEDLAKHSQAEFMPIWLESSALLRIERAQRRLDEGGNPSAVSQERVKNAVIYGQVDWPIIDASGDISSVNKAVLEKIQAR